MINQSTPKNLIKFEISNDLTGLLSKTNKTNKQTNYLQYSLLSGALMNLVFEAFLFNVQKSQCHSKCCSKLMLSLVNEKLYFHNVPKHCHRAPDMRGIEANSETIFFISQQKHML